jgi:multisubunit Na+/H+ antiporter MnhE subunit
MDLDFSVSSLLAGFIFGVVGYYTLRHAKKNANIAASVLAVTLMVYPYFISGAWLTWIVGFALCGATYYVW